MQDDMADEGSFPRIILVGEKDWRARGDRKDALERGNKMNAPTTDIEIGRLERDACDEGGTNVRLERELIWDKATMVGILEQGGGGGIDAPLTRFRLTPALTRSAIIAWDAGFANGYDRANDWAQWWHDNCGEIVQVPRPKGDIEGALGRYVAKMTESV